MKWAFGFLLVTHGFIHLLGFIKEFHLANTSGLSAQTIVPLSRPLSSVAGIVWILVCITFLATAVTFFLQKQWWWMPGLIALPLSQALIVLYWKDAKWGTITNLVVFVPLLVAYAEWKFDRSVKKEIDNLLSAPISKNVVVTQEMIARLPLPVQRWLQNSGVVGKEMAHLAGLKQKGLMRLKPQSSTWIEVSAVQYFRWDNPAFIWKVKMNMMPLVPVKGRDCLVKGKAAVQIKALSLINMVNKYNLPKLNQSAGQRLLAEMCWTPSAALSPFIQWEGVDDTTAKATIKLEHTSADVTFLFTREGDVKACRANRYKDSDAAAQMEKWEVVSKKYGVLNGVRMPVESEATWKLEEGDFTWFKLVITDVKYNNPQRYKDD